MLVRFIDCTDARMVQGRGSFGLTLESAQRLRIAGNFARKELEGDKPFQLDVLGFVDDAHAAAAQPFHDLVVRDGFPEQDASPLEMYGSGEIESTKRRAMTIQRRKGPPRIRDCWYINSSIEVSDFMLPPHS